MKQTHKNYLKIFIDCWITYEHLIWAVWDMLKRDMPVNKAAVIKHLKSQIRIYGSDLLSLTGAEYFQNRQVYVQEVPASLKTWICATWQIQPIEDKSYEIIYHDIISKK